MGSRNMLAAGVSALLFLMIAGLVGAETHQKTEIREGGLVANLWRPTEPGTHPGVLILGGSGGGIAWQDHIGEQLAERGYVALALAYFGMDGLPQELERIPLEYIEHGLTHLRLQPDVDRRRIAVVGVSKGGELALLVASMTPLIHAVVAFVPSSVVWQSIADGFPETSSWSYRGRELPFVPYGSVEKPRSLSDFYLAGLEQAQSLDSAIIQVERVNGPILLLSGVEDSLWPSKLFCDQVEQRLKDQGFSHQVVHIAYPDAGHLISRIRDNDASSRGGTEEGNRLAQIDARDQMFTFLDQSLQLKAKGVAAKSHGGP